MINIRELYVNQLSPETSQEDRELALNMISSFYDNPQSVLILLQQISAEQNASIRHMSAIGLGRSLSLNWKKHISASEYAEAVKEQLIKIYLSESDTTIRHRLIYSSRPILRTDAEKWPQYQQMISELTSNGSQLANIEFAMYAISHMIPHLAPNTVSHHLSFFIGLILNSFETDDQELVSTACGLCSVLLASDGLTEEEVALFVEVFQKMLEIFANSLSSGDDNYIRKITEKICFAMAKSQIPIPIENVLQFLLNNCVNIHPIYAYGPIIDLISAHGNELMSMLDQIIQVTFSVASDLLVYGTYEENENSMYVLLAIEKSAATMKEKTFFEYLFSHIPTGSTKEAIVSAMIISRVISNSEYVIKHISQIYQFVNLIFNIDNVCAKEIAIEIIGDVSKMFEEGQSEIGSQFLELLVRVLEYNDTDIIQRALKALQKLLSCVDIPIQLIGTTLTRLINLLNMQTTILPSLIFDALSSLVFSAGYDIAPYNEQIFPIIVQAASIPEEQDPSLKANALEALSNIVRFSSNVSNIIQPSVELLLQSVQTSDYDIRSSVMASFSNILVRDVPEIGQYSEGIFKAIFTILSDEIAPDETEFDINGNDDEDEDDMENLFTGNQSQINSITNTFLFIKNIFKLCKYLIPDENIVIQLLQSCYSYMDAMTEDLTVAATLAATYIHIKFTEIDLSEFFKLVLKHLDEEDGATNVATCFKVMSRFLERDIQLPGEIVQEVVNYAKKGLKGKLECQDEDTDNSEPALLTLSMHIYRFLATIATKIPQIFPINEFIDHQKHTQSDFELSQLIGVLRQYYLNYRQQIGNLQMKKIIQIIIEGLPICNFSVIPEPIIAIRKLFDKEPNIILPKIQIVFKYINDLLEQENEGELYYWATMTDIVSFLCSMLINEQTRDETYQTYFPKILSLLPVKGDEMEAEHIYSTLLSFSSRCTENELLLNELIRVFVQTLSLKEKTLSTFNLTENTYEGIINFVKLYLSNSNFLEVIKSYVQDESSYQNLQQRLSIY